MSRVKIKKDLAAPLETTKKHTYIHTYIHTYAHTCLYIEQDCEEVAKS